jgi:hypothetical protein
LVAFGSGAAPVDAAATASSIAEPMYAHYVSRRAVGVTIDRWRGRVELWSVGLRFARWLLQMLPSSSLDLNELNIKQQRLINHALILQHEPKRAITGKVCRLRLFRAPFLPIRVPERVIRRHDDATNRPNLHPDDGFAKRPDDVLIVWRESEEILIFPGECPALTLITSLKLRQRDTLITRG